MAAITAELAGGAEVVRFLDLIAWSEGTSTSVLTRCNGYDVIVTSVYGPEVFTSYADHPFACGRPANVVTRVPLRQSTAAGRYQVLLRYWIAYKEELKLTDFSPLSQDLVALQQIKERHAIDPLKAGDLSTAITRCSNIWASLPGNKYNQPNRTLAALTTKYSDLGRSV